jgi:hypothetical protein
MNSHVENAQVHPFVGNKLRIHHREDDERADAEDEGEKLDKNKFVGVCVGQRGGVDDHDAEDGANNAQPKQQHVRALAEILYSRPKFLRLCHRLIFEFAESPGAVFCILSHYCPLRNAIRGVIIPSNKNGKTNQRGFLCRAL